MAKQQFSQSAWELRKVVYRIALLTFCVVCQLPVVGILGFLTLGLGLRTLSGVEKLEG